eukprot:1136928-Pelagomonas_calceolata.AAC.5
MHAQVPDATGCSTLLVDLGCFSLCSAPPGSQQQPADRAQAKGSGLMSLRVWPEAQDGMRGLPGVLALSAEEAAVYEVRHWFTLTSIQPDILADQVLVKHAHAA